MAESLGQATVDLIANTGGFEAGMDRAARKMQSVSKEAAYQGNQLEKLVGAIDPVTGALNRLDKQQQQLDAHFKAGRLPIEDYQKFTGILNAQKVATDATVSGFGKLDRQMAANGQTLKQYQSNLRGVPAQFTDIFTSLQGGQAPLTVLLQQGGQLKDMFGGVGAAGKALGGYVLGLVNPITLVAAAVAATGVAYYQGSKEATAYNTALINTGNFAGTSADALAGMAARVAQTTGTVGAAAAVLAQIAGSGKIAVDQFELIATAALATQKATGQAASEIVANFVKIADDPLKATLELNKQMNYLTETVYSQIAAFQASGDTQAAVNLAQNEYAKAQKERAAGIIEDLGYVEAAWNSVAAAAKGAWDAFLSVGRTSPLEDQIKKAQELVATLDSAKKNAFPGAPSNSIREEQAQKDLTDLLVQYEERKRREASTRIGAQQKKDALEAAQYLDKVNTEFADKQSQRDKARAAYNLNVEKLRAAVAGGTVLATDPRLNAERIAKDLDGIDAKYAEKKTARAQSVQAYVEDAGTKELDQARQVYAALQAQSLAIGTQEGATRKIGAAAQELAKWEQQIADIKTKGTLTAAQKSLLADESAITAQKQQNAQLEAQNALRATAAASAQKLLSLQQQLNDELQNVQSGFALQMAGIGLGDEARKRLQDDLKIREDYQSKLEKLDRDYRKIQNPTEADTKAYEDQNVAIKEALGRRLGIQQDYYAAEDAAQTEWSNGALQAINTYLEEVNNLASQTRSLVSNAIGGLEDVFVKLATDGKLSFKSLADSIIADLARIAAKTLIVQPLLASLSSGGGVLSGVLGGAGGGSSTSDQALGVLDAAGKSISLASSGFGQAVQAGWVAGEGFVGGIQGAFSSGSGYISDAITSAFSSGSATAANVLAESAASGVGYELGGAAVSGEVGSATYASAGAASSGISSTNVVTAAISGFIQGYKANGIKGGVAAAGGAVGGMYAGAQLGSSFGPIGTAVGAVIGTVVGAAFGSSIFAGDWVTKDQGLQVGVDDGMLKAANYEYQKKKGGLFHSNKKRTNLSALDPGLQKALDDSYDGTIGTVLGLFDALNVELNDGVLDGLNVASTKISTQGKTSEAIQAELVTWFSALGDAAVGAVDTALGGVGLGGRTVESLTGLVNNLFSVNNVLANLNVGIYDVSVSGALMAERLAVVAGGFDKLSESASTYYDKFFTDAEKAEDVLKAVGVQFASVGVGLPATRQGFRDLVEALDVTTEAGRQMFTVLVGLSGNAAAAYDILEKQAAEAAAAAAAAQQKILDGFIGAAGAAQSAVERAINAQKASINDMLQTAQTNVSELTSVSNDLGNAIKALRGDSDSAVKMLRAQAVATLQSALATARAGGSLANFPGLSDALDTVSNNNQDMYASLEEFNRDQAQTAYTLDQLNTLNGKQLTSAEQTVKALQSQLERLDRQLEFAQAQLDALNGVDTSIKGVTEAIAALNIAVLAAFKGGVGAGSIPNTSTATTAIQTAYNSVLGRDAEAAGLQYWLGEMAAGRISLGQIEEAIRNAAKANGSIPAFARGTNSWDGGPAIMGEFGPELVMPNGGATVYNAQDTSRILNRTGNSDPQAASDLRDQARKNDQRWTQLLRYTQYLEQGFINGFPTVAED